MKLVLFASSLILAAPVLAAAPKAGSSAELAILETTDLHSAVVGYDYFKLAADPSLGLDRTASLIAQARRVFISRIIQCSFKPLSRSSNCWIERIYNYIS